MLPQHLPQHLAPVYRSRLNFSSVDDIAGGRRLGEVTSYHLAVGLLDPSVRRVGSRGFKWVFTHYKDIHRGRQK